MKKELENKLFEKYPKIFQRNNDDKTVTCMCWGIECPDAWYNLIDIMCAQLQFDTDKNKFPQVIAEQVKEKYGTLRFYYFTENNNEDIKEYWAAQHEGEITGFIKACENMTGYICAKCGSNKNVKPTKGWITYLCEDCFDK